MHESSPLSAPKNIGDCIRSRDESIGTPLDQLFKTEIYRDIQYNVAVCVEHRLNMVDHQSLFGLLVT
jgi:hypothetical protein